MAIRPMPKWWALIFQGTGELKLVTKKMMEFVYANEGPVFGGDGMTKEEAIRDADRRRQAWVECGAR